MGHRVQKEFSSDRFKTMSQKMMSISRDLGVYRGVADTVNEDNKAIRKAQKQSVDAFGALEVELGKGLAGVKFNEWRLTQLKKQCNENADKLLDYNEYIEKLTKKLENEICRNNDLRKWLEGYIILLFAIVVCFIIAVCVL